MRYMHRISTSPVLPNPCICLEKIDSKSVSLGVWISVGARDEIKGAAESLLLELVGQRALYDFLVVCDESNNTPSRIDRNELYLDIAIEPVKAVEFIYIPLRLKNTGEIAGL